jgi:hypothetical protein
MRQAGPRPADLLSHTSRKEAMTRPVSILVARTIRCSDTVDTVVPRRPAFRLIAFLLAVTPPAALAQWSTDPAQNLGVAVRNGDQVQPKVQATPDGGCYLSWLDNAGGGYDVYLQRLDAAGAEQWPHNGIQIADRSFSSTQDYGLSIDAAGHALLAFRDDRGGSEQVTATRVAPDGTQVWGAGGVALTADAAFKGSPKIAGTSDGDIVVAWTSDTQVKLQRLDGDGNPLWGAGVTLSDPGAQFLLSDLHASNDGAVILSFVRQVSFQAAKHLYAQKLAADGSPLWSASHVRVFDGGSLQFGNFPTFISDGAGGAVFGWYSSSPALQCFAQHIDAEAAELFGHNGAAGSTLATQIRVSPSVGYDPATQQTFLFWTEQNSSQSQHGVYGQKFDVAGARQWGDNGRVLVPVSATERTQVRTLAYGGGALVFFVDKPSPPFGQRVLATRVDGNGDFVWAPSILPASSAVAGKSRLFAETGACGNALLAWSDARTDSGDVYAQSVNGDGTLGGTPACGCEPCDANCDGAVDAFDIEPFINCLVGP